MATTTTNEVYRLDLTNRRSPSSPTGHPRPGHGSAGGLGLTSPDNLAVDHEGNIYIIEDRNGGVDDDIWFAKDLNKDGDLNDAGEGLGRWASNGTPDRNSPASTSTRSNKRRAWVNIQHPTSGNDRTIEITIP